MIVRLLLVLKSPGKPLRASRHTYQWYCAASQDQTSPENDLLWRPYVDYSSSLQSRLRFLLAGRQLVYWTLPNRRGLQRRVAPIACQSGCR